MYYPENEIIESFFQKFDRNIIEEKNLNIGQLSREIGVSERTYRRTFQKVTGISPKLYYQIKRMEIILVELHKRPNKKYLDLLRGYVDQSHFIKDFIRFTGQSPKVLQTFFKDEKLTQIYNYL